MKTNTLKKALSRHEMTYGCWVTLAHPLIPEILSQAGFDWLTIDMEHSSIELGDLLPLIISTEANGMVPLVRVGENNPNLIKRVMDAGAYGVIVPNVNSAGEAQRAVDSVKYPPYGKRGVGLYRAQRYGREFEAYKKWLAKESVVIIQIEHIDAVRDIDNIFAVEGIDAFVVGPYDLSGSLGCPGEFDRPVVKQAIARYERVCKKMRKPMGFHVVQPEPKRVMALKKKGYAFLAVGIDTLYLGIKARDTLKESC